MLSQLLDDDCRCGAILLAINTSDTKRGAVPEFTYAIADTSIRLTQSMRHRYHDPGTRVSNRVAKCDRTAEHNGVCEDQGRDWKTGQTRSR
jgi:hypothetical protein